MAQGDLAAFLALKILDMNQTDRVSLITRTMKLFVDELLRAGHTQEAAIAQMNDLLDRTVELVRQAHLHDPGSS